MGLRIGSKTVSSLPQKPEIANVIFKTNSVEISPIKIKGLRAPLKKSVITANEIEITATLPTKRYSSVNEGRKGFTIEELDKFSHFSYDLASEGFSVPIGTKGRVIQSDTSTAKIARLSNNLPNPNGDGFLRYIQSGDKGVIFKHLVAQPTSNIAYIAEGFFKALAIHKAGFNAVSYSGVNSIFTGKVLNPEFVELIKNYTHIVITYDIDDTPDKRYYAEKQILRITEALHKFNKSVSIVESWDRKLYGKDLDEILAKHGLPALNLILENFNPLNTWEGFAVKTAYTATYKEESNYLGAIVLELITKYRLSFINAPMGAGKTYKLANVLKDLYPELGSLIVSPLIVLGKQICKDLQEQGIQITYREDMEASKNWKRIITCLESVKPTSKLQIDLDGSQLQDKIIIIDELSQVVETLLSGSTISKERKTIVECFTACLRQAKKVICMGADINDFDCGVIEKLIGDSLTQNDICKYQNTFKRNQFKAVITTPTEAIATAHILASAGYRVMLAVDSQKSTSTFSGINIKEMVAQYGCEFKLAAVPEEKVLVIDSVTTKIIGHEAHEIVQKGRKDLLLNKNLVICSPSVDKGWSLPADSKFFDVIVVLHTGQSDPDSVCQFTMRDRNLEIPRIIAFSGQERLGLGGGFTGSQIKAAMMESISLIETATNAKKYRAVIDQYELNTYFDLGFNLNIGSTTLEKEFCIGQAIKNLKHSMREHYVRTKLMAQGATFYNSIREIFPPELLDVIDIAHGRALAPRNSMLKEIAKETTQAEANREFNAPNFDDKQVEKLKDVGALTQIEIDARNKYFTRKAAKFEDICVEDISDHKWGKFQPEALWFYLSQGRQFVAFLESTRIAGLRDIPLHNPTALMIEQAANFEEVYSQDIVTGALAHKIGLLEKIKLKEAVEYAQKNGVADLFLIGTAEQKLVPEPILECLNLVREHKKELVAAFNWDWKDFKAKDTILFERALETVGYKYSSTQQIRVIDETTKTVHRPRISFEIITDRKPQLQRKRFSAMQADLIEKENIFINNQLLAQVGRDLIKRVRTEGNFADLLGNYKQDILLESARRLPRLAKNGEGYGLSEHFKLLAIINNFQPKLEAEIVVIDEFNVSAFNTAITHWIEQKKDIGFDTETYESLTHKQFCEINKNGKYQWLNKYTGRNQTVEPGLDQNHNLVRLLQLSDGSTTYVLDLGKCDGVAVPLWLKGTWQLIQKLAESNTLVGHNMKFDTSSLVKYDVHVKHPYCTLITTKLLFGDCGAGKVLSGGYNLKSVAFHLLGITVDKEQQKSNWGANNLSESQLVYAAKDAVVALALREILELILNNPIAWNLPEMLGADGKHANLSLIRLENANIYPTTEMQWRGVPVNVPAVTECITKLQGLVSKVELEWELLRMPCKPSQPAKVVEEMNRRYYDREHPFTAFELIQALGIELIDDAGELLDLEEIPTESLQLPSLDKPLAKSSKDIINDHSDLPEFNLLKAYRSYMSAIVQLSKVLISAEINGGRCKTEYQPLSGTGRMSCGNNKGLGTPNLQAFIKKAEGRYFGFSTDPIKRTLTNWWLPAIEEAVKIRILFELTNNEYAFITEDANASHARLAIGFGQCEFGKQSQIGGIDSHSMFAMMALKAILNEDINALNQFPQIRDFVLILDETNIKDCTKTFKELDAQVSSERFRSAAKTLFYSVLNGAQADKMRKVLSNAIGKPVSIAAGDTMFNKFWSLYQGIKNFIDKVLEYADNHAINFGGFEYNITELPDGTKLMYGRKNGELAVTNLIACQWSRAEATAIKKIMQAASTKLPSYYEVELINQVHDEVGFTCKAVYWQEVYQFLSDEFARQYDVYLQGFIPCDEPTEVKLAKKLEADVYYVPTSWADK